MYNLFIVRCPRTQRVTTDITINVEGVKLVYLKGSFRLEDAIWAAKKFGSSYSAFIADPEIMRDMYFDHVFFRVSEDHLTGYEICNETLAEHEKHNAIKGMTIFVKEII